MREGYRITQAPRNRQAVRCVPLIITCLFHDAREMTKGENQVHDSFSYSPIPEEGRRYQAIAASLGSLSPRNRITDLYAFLCLPLISPVLQRVGFRFHRGYIQVPLQFFLRVFGSCILVGTFGYILQSDAAFHVYLCAKCWSMVVSHSCV
jgi:hypothetical protein